MKPMISFILAATALATMVGPAAANDYEDRSRFVFAVLKYNGGGDWYNGLTGVRNLLLFCQKNTDLRISLKEKVVGLLDDDLFNYPFLYMNGHGNVVMSDQEVKRLRLYLENGGFLFCNDDFGIDPYFRREMKRVFPDKELTELPFSSPVYHTVYDFPSGVPKIHQHEGGAPRGYGLFLNGRMAVFYDFDADIADGWEEEWVHNDPSDVRNKALQMGVNIITYALLH